MRRLLIVCLLLPCLLAAGEEVWTWTNPTKSDYAAAPLRLPLPVPDEAFNVSVGGRVVPHHVIGTGADRELWVVVDLAAGATMEARITPPVQTVLPESVEVEIGEEAIVFANEHLAVKLPASHAGEIRPPLLGLRHPGGDWVGSGTWHHAAAFQGCETEVVADGTGFARARMRYAFAGEGAGGEPAFAEIVVTLLAGRPYAIVEERHAMGRGDYYELDLAAGWEARRARIRIHGAGPSGRHGQERKRGDWTLETDQTRWGHTLVQLMPRWTQHYDDGWFFNLHDGERGLGAMVGRASRWTWPHDNEIRVRVRESGDYAGLRCPTWHGSRYWLLTALPPGDGKAADALARRAFIRPLDKLVHEYITAWPGRGGTFRSEKPYGDHINPTGMWRGQGRNALRNAGGKTGKAGIGQLTYVQSLLHPDTYGSYWDYMSPENPNFFTDFIKRPVGEAANLAEHPDFAAIRALVEQKVREDIFHSVTLPGGAGQECPGYLAHALGGWEGMAKVCTEHFDFDPRTWPRYRAAVEFLVRTSQPVGGGKRRMHPGGDTHPPGKDIAGLMMRHGIVVHFDELATGEFPGFGVVFRGAPGTERESYVAFKAGPNRGHYHGDQLSLHVCAGASPRAVDHMCSYAPRAGQEHMHNRISFGTEEMPYANMDGYERLIAFKTGARADVAVAQVASPRLRRVTPKPPEEWDARVDILPLDGELVYRRTAVFVRDPDGDYLVLRDQYRAPRELTATYNLHVLGGNADRKGGEVRFDGLTLVVLGGADDAFAELPFAYERKGWSESTRGVRFARSGAAGEFVSVLLLGGDQAVRPTESGVAVGADELRFAGGIDEVSEAPPVKLLGGGSGDLVLGWDEIDLERSQGEIGLFVPDAGYPFGPIPDWLIEQRAGRRPDWYRSWREIVTAAATE